MASADKRTPAMTLLIRPLGNGRFEIREGEHLLGTSQNEMMAVWSAVTAAELMAKSGQTVRVVRFQDEIEIEEFVATPPGTH